MPGASHTRRTVSRLTPTCWATPRVDQWVSPPGGRVVQVTSMIFSITFGPQVGFLPRPGATRPTPSTPSASKRRRHRRTVSPRTPTRRATSLVATPSPAINKAAAALTWLCAKDGERAIRSRASRCSTVISRGAATMRAIPTHYHAHFPCQIRCPKSPICAVR